MDIPTRTEPIAKKLTEKTGVKLITACDGMKFDLSELDNIEMLNSWGFPLRGMTSYLDATLRVTKERVGATRRR